MPEWLLKLPLPFYDADKGAGTGGADKSADAGAAGAAGGDGKGAADGGGDRSLLEGAGATDDKKGGATPASWPEDWRARMAGKDEKLLGRLGRFASPENVVKSWLAAEQKISSGEVKRALPEGATEAQVAEWRKEQGIPEKPDGYLEKLPDGVIVGEDDKAMLAEFAKDMHGLHADPKFVHAAIGSYYKLMEKIAADQEVADADYRRTQEDELRAEWGTEYRANVTAMNSLLNTAPEGVKENFFGARLADGTRLGDNATVLRWLTSLAREINPTGTVVPGGAGAQVNTIEGRLAELTKMMGDKRSEYWSGPKANALQKEYRDLFDAREKLKARAA